MIYYKTRGRRKITILRKTKKKKIHNIFLRFVYCKNITIGQVRKSNSFHFGHSKYPIINLVQPLQTLKQRVSYEKIMRHVFLCSIKYYLHCLAHVLQEEYEFSFMTVFVRFF